MDPSVPAVGGEIVTVGGVGSGKWGGVSVTLQFEAKQSPNFPVHLRCEDIPAWISLCCDSALAHKNKGSSG